MAPPGGKDLTYKVFGLDHMGGEVVASVFARQITDIVSGLKKVDRAENGGQRFEYTIAGLEIGSAQIEFREKIVSEKPFRTSPAKKMVDVGRQISGGRTFSPSTEAEEEIVQIYKKLSNKADTDFSYATLRGQESDPLRVDRFLKRQVDRVISSAKSAAESVKPRFFVGDAIGSFDGVIEAVDLKGDAPEARLVLTAGGKRIECVLFDMQLEEMQAVLGNRVSVTGRAVYEGLTGLPSRIEIRRARVIAKADSTGLSGALHPFDYTEWSELLG
ncbi:MAG: hypothetical protein H6905_11550 [Hyphomicrobiales bacterium]|nr:hypothetical protein [Hyphomicrobiales bacterium]